MSIAATTNINWNHKQSAVQSYTAFTEDLRQYLESSSPAWFGIVYISRHSSQVKQGAKIDQTRQKRVRK